MRRLAAILAFALILGGIIPSTASAATLSAPGDIYLAMGNSLSVGAEAPANNDGQPGYPSLLNSRLQEINPDLQLQLVGVAGETSSTLISGGQLASAEGAITSATASGKCVGLITLDIGGNDFGQILTRETTPAQAIPTFRTNLSTILGRISSAASNQVAGCSPRLALMDYYNPYPGLGIPPSGQPLSDIYLPELNSIIRDTAADYGWSVANVEAAFRGREADLLYVNQGIYTNPLLLIPFLPWFEGNVDFHPRPEGHQVIADAFWQALAIVPTVPQLLELPDLIPANMSLVTPWTCGECALAGREQAALQALPEPDARNIEWLGAQLWNRITRPLLCWLMGMMQVGLNLYAGTLNTLWIPALNTFFRLLYALFFWMTSAFLAIWYLGEDIRMQLWGINATLAAQAGGALTTATATGELLDSVLRAWVAVFTGALAPWSYFVSLYSGTVAQILDTVTHLQEHRPEQLVALDDYWLFAALVGTLRGFSESGLGWWLIAQVGMFYLATGLFILDQAAEV